jgi:hypothetical protein
MSRALVVSSTHIPGRWRPPDSFLKWSKNPWNALYLEFHDLTDRIDPPCCDVTKEAAINEPVERNGQPVMPSEWRRSESPLVAFVLSFLGSHAV